MAALGVNFGLWAIALLPAWFVVRDLGLREKTSETLRIRVVSTI